MTLEMLQLTRRLHHEIGGVPRQRTVELRAGDVLDLINALWAEEQRADVAEAREAGGALNLETSPVGGEPGAARATTEPHAWAGPHRRLTFCSP